MAQTKVTGAGGYIVRDAVAGGQAPFDNAVRFDVGKWSLDVEAVIAEATESDANGWEDGLVGLYRVNGVTIELIQKQETAAIFELSCCPIGGRVTLFLKKGGTSFCDKVTNTIFQGLTKDDSSRDGEPIREVAKFVKGTASFNIAMPTTFNTP